MRCRLDASAKNVKTRSRGSGSAIAVVNVCSIGILYDEVDRVTRRSLS
jgi:hypothetical protein